MQQRTKTGRLVRWGVPVAMVAVIAGAISAGPVIAAVSGEPVLPERTAGQLLADAAAAVQKDGMKPMSGTVLETASLGLPPLPTGVDASSPISLLSGSREAKVWYGDRDHFRLALPGKMSETNVIVNGDQTWLWDSGTNTATKIKAPAGVGQREEPPSHTPAAVTPQQAAEKVLAAAGEHTDVSVTNNTKVAGRPVYQLVLAPKAEASLVQQVRVALDGETYVPLQVEVYAKGSAEPAFKVGFTQVTFTPPAKENFTFTPPAGATVKEQTIGAGDLAGKPEHAGPDKALEAQVKTVGTGWTTVAVAPFSADALTAAPKQGEQEGPDLSGFADTVLKSATPVSGPWGSGKVIKTKLVSVLLTDDGRVLAGAVTPEELTKAAGTR